MNKYIQSGNWVGAECHYCGNLVRLNGFWKGVHICLTSEERARVDAHTPTLLAQQRIRQQKAYDVKS